MTKATWWQYLLPQQWLTRCAGALAQCRWAWLKNRLIRAFIRYFGVNMAEAQIEDYRQYPCFNDFFIRALKPSARPLKIDDKHVLSPVDGVISACGAIENDQLFQAKGHVFSLCALLGSDDEHARSFERGAFMTAYLSPKDYHRFHFPVAAKLVAMRHIPGRLFSVNATSVADIPGLFAKNERVVCFFETEFGPFALVAVGAMIVGSIATEWHGTVNTPRQGVISDWRYEGAPQYFKQGDLLGHFKLGSTVIMLFPENAIAFEQSVSAGALLQLGQTLATVLDLP